MGHASAALELWNKHVGSEEGVGEWFAVDQSRINAFADATLDHQFIHIDPEKAAKLSPYKVTIAHGFLTLSLLSQLLSDSIEIAGKRMGINYGLNRLRFTSPVPSGSRVRARFALAALDPVEGGVQTTWNVTVDLEGGDKPALVAEWLTRHYR